MLVPQGLAFYFFFIMHNMVTLFKSQFMLVRWQASQFEYIDDKNRKKIRLLISLDIVLQINGWLRTLTPEYVLYNFEESAIITFADWQRWTDFYNLMYELGYPMTKWEVHDVVLGSTIIKDWIERLYPNYTYTEDFEWVWTKRIAEENLNMVRVTNRI